MPSLKSLKVRIASGKSTVSRYLEKKGYLRIDADQIVADLYQKPALEKRIARLLGSNVLSPSGLDRGEMLKAIKANPKKKKALEKMIHPLVYRAVLAQLASLTSGKVVLDVPLLLHSPLEEVADLIIYISANEKNQIARLVERGKDPEAALALNKGYPRALLKKKAGILLSGDGRKEDLE